MRSALVLGLALVWLVAGCGGPTGEPPAGPPGAGDDVVAVGSPAPPPGAGDDVAAVGSPAPPPAQLSGMITVADLVEALRAHGAEDARDTGETLPLPILGATAGQVIEVLGQKVQVYTMPSPERAEAAAALDPVRDTTISWVAPPRFVAVGNLLVTVVVPEQEIAHKIVIYLEMVRRR
jgi:hypothetical protein